MTRTLAELAAEVGADLEGDGAIEITSAAPIETAGPGQISFVANPKYAQYIATTRASALVLDRKIACDRLPVIRHDDPYLTFALIVDLLYPPGRLVEPGIHPSAVIEDGVDIGEGSGIGPLCHVQAGVTIGRNCELVSGVFIGREAVLGDNCRLYAGVKVASACRLGSNVTIHPGTVIGSDGFGYARSDAGMKKIQQVGWVEIGEDVEIGANTTIDRGAIGPTRIGRGTKIDNLVQIAHNVEIGEHSIIVSQVGISGSSKLGRGVVLGGQVGLAGHIKLGDGVQVGAQSGVSKSIPAGRTWFGYPAREIMETMRIDAALNRLPELLRRVKKIEDKLEE